MNDPTSNAAAPDQERRFLTFRMAERLYALPAEDVTEIIPVPPVTHVPQGPKSLLGLANLRGSVLPVASLRHLLGMQAIATPDSSRVIVLDAAPLAALEVDRIDGLVGVGGDRIETRQTEFATVAGEILQGVFKSAATDEAVKILDVRTLLSTAFTQRTQQQTPARPQLALSEAAADEDVAVEAEMLMIFDVAGQDYALALDAVREIVALPSSVTALPRTETLVLGVVTFRDSLLSLLSLRGLLGFPLPETFSGREKIVVTRVSGILVGLVADRMRAILSADPRLIEQIPAVLAARTGGESRIKSIYRGDSGRGLISILAPEMLFAEDVMRRLGAQGELADSRMLATDDGAAVAEEQHVLVFRLGDEEYALPIAAVDEIARAPDQVTRVPKAPKFLDGVINLRGMVLPVIDQRRRFDMPKLESGAKRRLIVVRTENHRAGLIVDGITEILRIAGDAIEPAPALTDDTARLVKGVINLQKAGRMVLVLEPAELLTRAERGLLDAFEARLGDPKPGDAKPGDAKTGRANA